MGFHGWKELILVVCNNIWSVMTIKVKPLLVTDILEALEVEPTMDSAQ